MSFGRFRDITDSDPDLTGSGGPNVCSIGVGLGIVQQVPGRNQESDTGTRAPCNTLTVPKPQKLGVILCVILGLFSVGCSSFLCLF